MHMHINIKLARARAREREREREGDLDTGVMGRSEDGNRLERRHFHRNRRGIYRAARVEGLIHRGGLIAAQAV